MKISKYLNSQCIMLFTPNTEETTDNATILNLIRSIEERYGFLQGPRAVSEFNPKDGITFLEGQFKKEHRISRFQFFDNGLLAEGPIPTETLDDFLDDLRQWTGEYAVRPYVEVAPQARAYLSEIEVEVDLDIEDYFEVFSAVGKEISERVESYGQNVLDFKATQITLSCDSLNLPSPKPGVPFKFGRRDGYAYDSKVYFSSAPLRTVDHLQMTKSIISILSSKK